MFEKTFVIKKTEKIPERKLRNFPVRKRLDSFSAECASGFLVKLSH